MEYMVLALAIGAIGTFAGAALGMGYALLRKQ